MIKQLLQILVMPFLLCLGGCATSSANKITVVGKVELYRSAEVFPGGTAFGYLTVDVEQPEGFTDLSEAQIWVPDGKDLKVPGGIIEDGDTIAFKITQPTATGAWSISRLEALQIIAKRRK